MTAHGGEALDVAMGLLRAPGLRTALRARPLPEGVGELLAIAAGSADGARRAAARTGYDEAALVEAARFYVQQVLLAEDADAYRILGAPRDAGHATLRDHHRLLLRWLHPDRSDDRQWSSTLATRVNQAWNLLRDRRSRARYDATLDATAPPAAPAPHHPPTLRAAAPPPSRVAPVAVIALGVACLGLVWLAVQREDSPGALPAAPQPAAAPAADEPPSATTLPAPLAAIREMVTIATQAAPDPAPTTRPAAPPSGTPARDRAPPSGSEPSQAPAAVVARTSIEPVPASVSVPAPTIELASTTRPLALPPPASTPAPAAMAATAMALPLPPDVRTADHPDITPPASTPAISATISAPAVIGHTPDPTVDDDPLRLLHEAEAAVRAVTTYLGARDGPPPAWQDAPTGHAAAATRSQLLARNGEPAQPRLSLDSPNWTLGSQAASVLAPYRLDGGSTPLETGVLSLELSRGSQQWRVTSLRLDPTP